MKSVSGIRGTIGGKPGDNLTPPDIVAFTAAYGYWLKERHERPAVVIGRDGRISGALVKALVVHTLQALGIDIIDLDYSTTPTVEMYVIKSGATGGIIITASHNPEEWNALKFLDHRGEFISPEAGEAIRRMAEAGSTGVLFATVHQLGIAEQRNDAIQHHIGAILEHPLIDAAAIKAKGLTVVVDCINSTGSLSLPPLLDALGVQYTLINDDLSGMFAHNPEPLPEHLAGLSEEVLTRKASLGISIDPDVDRLALVMENGRFFGEEYTLVCAADYVLRHSPGPVVTNLSSSRALADLARSYDVPCYYSKVGEVHVVSEMKKRKAVFGGEGNGGVIDPKLHYGRDALIGIALVLMNLVTSGKKLSELKDGYARYEMVKDKVTLAPGQDADLLLEKVAAAFHAYDIDTRDGLRIDLPDAWVQLRKSNTEPILRIYAEAGTREDARKLAQKVKEAF